MRMLSAEQHAQTLTSSAAPVLREQRGVKGQLARLTEQWQTTAFTYYDLIGEIHYASNFYARGMTGCRFFAAERMDDGTIEETDFQPAIDSVARIQDPGGGTAQLAENYGRIMFVAGAGYMLWTPGDEGRADEFEFVSTDELRLQGDQFFRYRADGLPPEGIVNAPDDQFVPLPGEVRAWRYWTPHPRLSAAADSPMRAVLDLCEELWLLTKVVRARVKNRLAGNGILLVPTEVSPPPVPTVPPDEDGSGGSEGGGTQTMYAPEDPLNDPFLRDLIEHLTAPIADDGSAASVSPMVVRGPAEALKELRHLVLANRDEKYEEVGLRDECIRRIALGLDMPPEALLGMGTLNHWSGWIVDEQTWENIRPTVVGFCANVTSSYLVPDLAAQNVDDPSRYLLWYDPSEFLSDPDRGVAADAAHDRITISDEAYRNARGFTEDDAPDEDEYERRASQKGGAPVEEDEGEPGTEDEQDDGDPTLAARIMGAADVTIERARELAGGRILSALQGKGVELQVLRDVARADVAATLGPDVLSEARTPPASELVDGAAVAFANQLVKWGVAPKTAGALAHLVEAHAASTLTVQPAPAMPRSFVTTMRRAGVK